MSEMMTAALRKRIAELEAENARLRAKRNEFERWWRSSDDEMWALLREDVDGRRRRQRQTAPAAQAAAEARREWVRGIDADIEAALLSDWQASNAEIARRVAGFNPGYQSVRSIENRVRKVRKQTASHRDVAVRTRGEDCGKVSADIADGGRREHEIFRPEPSASG